MRFATFLVARTRVHVGDEVGEYSPARVTVKRWLRIFSAALAQQLGGQKVDFLRGRRLGRGRLTALGAATSDAAALAEQGAEGLPPDVADTAGDEEEDEEVLEPEGHGRAQF